jgi:hypothetical protein
MKSLRVIYVKILNKYNGEILIFRMFRGHGPSRLYVVPPYIYIYLVLYDPDEKKA